MLEKDVGNKLEESRHRENKENVCVSYVIENMKTNNQLKISSGRREQCGKTEKMVLPPYIWSGWVPYRLRNFQKFQRNPANAFGICLLDHDIKPKFGTYVFILYPIILKI